jgi:23S rRNA pseudouridine1911/1915/1917 synthase
MDKPCFPTWQAFTPAQPQASHRKLNNGEVTLNGVTAAGSEPVALGQTLVWKRPPWIEPESRRLVEVQLNDPHLLAVNKPSRLPGIPARAQCAQPNAAIRL